MKRTLFLMVVLLIIPCLADAKRLYPEKWYQQQWCQEHGGQTEEPLRDSTICDCLTETHAIELDFANKWMAAIGQSLNYSLQTGKRAGIVLILEKKKDYGYWRRLNELIDKFNLPIDTWKMGGGASEPE